MKKVIKRIICFAVFIAFVGLCAVSGISFYVKAQAASYILEPDIVDSGYDCILVLGCRVENGVPCHMLEDRLLCGIELYEKGASEKLLMSGDHGTDDYDEVNTMKNFAIDKGVESSDIFMDHAGFSTYESMYRAKEIFKAQKILIVTQKYHLYRAIYVARALGLDAYGVDSASRTYAGQIYRDIREILARDKDFFFSVFKPEPKCLGEAIPVQGNGDITNDKSEYFYE